MLKIIDNRNTGECQLRQVDIDGYFEYDGVLCRRVHWVDDLNIMPKGDDDYVIYCVGVGQVMALNMNTMVMPIADRKIELYIED